MWKEKLSSTLRKYKKGLAFAGEKQKQKIKNALYEFGQRYNEKPG